MNTWEIRKNICSFRLGKKKKKKQQQNDAFMESDKTECGQIYKYFLSRYMYLVITHLNCLFEKSH